MQRLNNLIPKSFHRNNLSKLFVYWSKTTSRVCASAGNSKEYISTESVNVEQTPSFNENSREKFYKIIELPLLSGVSIILRKQSAENPSFIYGSEETIQKLSRKW